MVLDQKQIGIFEEYVQTFMAEQQAPGLAITIAKGDAVIYEKAFGYRDQEHKLPVTTETVFGIASITKSFTAAAIAQLVEEGVINFEDPVVKHLPQFRLPDGSGDSIKLHHLLSHTSGIPPLPTLGYSIRGNTVPDPREDGKKPEIAVEEPRMNTVEDLLKFISTMDIELLGKPGEYFSYSNDCFGILGKVITEVSGMPYQQYIREKILVPLGMNRTLFSYEELTEYGDVTELYYKTEDDEVRHSHKWQVAPPFIPGGWLKSCARDLLRFFQMYANGGTYRDQRILARESVRANMEHAHKFSLTDSYAHGLRVRPNYHGVTLAEHGGSLKGVSSNAGFVPERGISAVVLCNLTGVPVAKVWLSAINLALGLPIDTPRNVYETTEWGPDAMERYAGSYKSGEGAEFDIVREDNNLVVKFKKETCGLKRLNDITGLIVFKGQEQEMRFYCDAQGRVSGVGYGVRIIPRM